jgi:hypothetical protein
MPPKKNFTPGSIASKVSSRTTTPQRGATAIDSTPLFAPAHQNATTRHNTSRMAPWAGLESPCGAGLAARTTPPIKPCKSVIQGKCPPQAEPPGVSFCNPSPSTPSASRGRNPTLDVQQTTAASQPWNRKTSLAITVPDA